MTTKAVYRNGLFTMFESTTHESLPIGAPILFEEDFFGTLNGDHWTAVDDGEATQAKVADVHGGVLGLIFTATGEKQEACLYGKDDLEFNIDKGPVFEWVVSLAVLPTAEAEMYFGVSDNYVEGLLAAADQGPLVHMCFMFDGSGICTIHTDDGVTSIDAIATGVTLTASATVRHVFKIDCTTPANVLFYIDGANVASAQTFDMSLGSLSFQPIATVFKPIPSAGVGSLYLDAFRAWSKR